jgi:hypothetical protein
VTEKDAKALVAQWKERDTVLKEVRREEVRAADTEQFILSMAGLLEGIVSGLPPRTTSGLIQQQAVFSKLRQ